MAISVSSDNRTFQRNGKHFFYLADTCWSAFTNITLEEWEYYLDLRKQQGFNVIQINALPQWDASGTELNCYPFPTENKQKFHFTELKNEYFIHGAKMCEIAKAKGFELALVVLWCNYVPDTWASEKVPDNIMPYDFLDGYIEKLHETFTGFDPIYVISGDTDFATERAKSYYKKASDMLKQLAPQCLQTFHIRGRLDSVPEEFLENMDFYMYQSGHNAQPENMNMPYTLAQTFYKNYPEKPILNSEPCYEQMGYSHRMYGRFYPYDIRRAGWMSLLSGGCAGIAYGAHGIYSWHRVGQRFGAGLGEGFDAPNSWNDAVKYPGAWDYGYMKYIFRIYGIQSLIPADIIANPSRDIRCAMTPDQEKYLIYVPNNTCVRLTMNPKDFEIVTIDLMTRQVAYPEVGEKKGLHFIGMHRFEQDALVILTKKKKEI